MNDFIFFIFTGLVIKGIDPKVAENVATTAFVHFQGKMDVFIEDINKFVDAQVEEHTNHLETAADCWAAQFRAEQLGLDWEA